MDKYLLSENIHFLGDRLGETIVQQAGRDVFEFEEQIRWAAKSWRRGGTEAAEKIEQHVAAIVRNPGLTFASAARMSLR